MLGFSKHQIHEGEMFLLRTLQSFSLCSLTFGALMSLAQQNQLSQLPATISPANAELRSQMLEAYKANGLIGADWPWHLKVSFNVLDSQGKIKDQGTYEEYWIRPNKFRQSYTSASFSQIDYGTDKGVMRSGETKWPPYLLRQIRKAFVDPMPPATDLENFKYTSENYAGMRCIRKSSAAVSPATPASISTYCLMTNSHALRMTLTGLDNGARFPRFNAIRTQSAMFKGRIIPSDLQVAVNMTLMKSMTAHLESLEVITKPDESLFVPTKDAKSPPDTSMVDPGLVSLEEMTAVVTNPQTQPAGVAVSAGVSAGLLLTKVDPVYPAIAIAARVSGTVVLEAHIDKEGKVETLRMVSGPRMLQQAAFDAVKQWRYRPYSMNGQPVEINTTINVLFQLKP